MIEGIKEIGSIVVAEEPENLLKNLTNEVPSEKKGKKQYTVIMEFDTVNKKINFDFEHVKEDTAERYLWVGNAEGSNSPQDRLTTNKLDYLVSQTLPNLKNSIKELGDLLSEFYFDTGHQKGQQRRYRFVLNVEKLGISSRSMEALWKEALKKTKPAQEMVKLVSKEVQNYLKKEKENLSSKDISLFTITVDGKLLANSKEYQDYLLKKKIAEAFENSVSGNCHLCGNKNQISFDTTKLRFTYYNTDKISFSSNLRGKNKDGFLKNYAFCKECYRSLLAGEKFVENYLHSRSPLGEIRLYIIPKFIFNAALSGKKLRRWSEYINVSFNSTVSLNGLREFERSIEDYKDQEDEKNSFVINLLFHKWNNNELRILKLIRDVPPSRLDTLKVKATEVADLGKRVIGESYYGYITLERIYYLLPIRFSKKRGRKENVDYKKLLEFYDSLFTGKPVSYHFLINQFVELASVYRFKKKNYNIKSSDQKKVDVDLVYALLDANLLLLYLRKLHLLEGGKSMESLEASDLSEDMKDFIKEMAYSEEQVALFLLGYLIGEIGSTKPQRDSSKPILNKIIFQGMNPGKLVRLSNDVFEKLIQYKKLSYNEVVFAEMKRLLGKHVKNWRLSDQENVFYVLCGYAYATHRAIREGKLKKLSDEEKVEEDNEESSEEQ